MRIKIIIDRKEKLLINDKGKKHIIKQNQMHKNTTILMNERRRIS